ncbi:glycosyltransferase family 4 protein [Herpetosiphon gulosus]|uniref:D-inositol-3-phosphate glycosyltransferase n=1 Tax=Herpetosiphon gulosus TaxID=1973496 RepID=A0ABP9X6F3_9CHLR
MKRIVLIAAGCENHCLRLQPWRYLCEVAAQLQQHGHAVTIISTGSDAASLVYGIPLIRLASIVAHPKNQALQAALHACNPEVVLWHLGKTSMLHGVYHYPGVVNIGIFTSPLYQLSQLWDIGMGRLLKNYELGAIHLAGALIPSQIFQQGYRRQQFDHVVVQTQTTKAHLRALGIPEHDMTVLLPGVDPDWLAKPPHASDDRDALGFHPSDHVLVYFGSPAPLRGLHTLFHAFRAARRQHPALRLLILSRRHPRELQRADAQLGHILQHPEIAPFVRIVSGYLPAQELVRHVTLADSVALPFDLVPSDAPLSLLEAHALGKPLITTAISCLPEFAAYGPHILAEAAKPSSLQQALIASSQHRYTPPTTPSLVQSWTEMGNQWHHFLGH